MTQAPSPISHNADIAHRAKEKLLQNYKQQPIALVRGEGCRVWDADRREYIDLISGIATCAMGHCHPLVIEAAKKQLDQLWHVSNGVYSEPQVQLAERLTAVSGLPGARAFFCNSGAEANEALIKLARRYQHEVKGNKERSNIITFEGGFHGRTLATVTATAQPKYHVGFEPLPQGFMYAPYGDIEALKPFINAQTAAILVEPIQGEGGVRVAPVGFLLALRELCTKEGILLMIDEVQTGIGRTGKYFAFQHDNIIPDAFSLAKSLGNGLPIGAMVCSDELSKALPSGSHGSTFGGNLVACAAACATWDLATTTKMLSENARKGALLLSLGNKLQAAQPTRVKEVRGRGLLFGVEVLVSAADVVAACREKGLLVNLAGEKTVRMAPAYVTSDSDLIEGFEILERAISGVALK
jgi:acetylornithine/N-succinyldiaminopimelate aminotransferase